MVKPTPEANRKNVAKFYDKNKFDINKIKVLCRIVDGGKVRQTTLDKYNITKDDLKDLQPQEDTRPITRSNKPIFNIGQLKAHYETRVDDDSITMAESTAKGYITTMNRVLKETGCNPDINIIDCLNEGKVLDHIIKTYANPNTRKTYLQVFLYAIDNTPKLKEQVKNRDKYFKAWKKAKNDADEFLIQKQVEGVVIRFSVLKERIEKEFPKDSQEVLLINLYDELTMRDDFDKVMILKKTPPPSKDDNYLVLSTGRIFINKFKKTGNKYDPVNHKLSPAFMKKLRSSLENDPKGERLMLFDKTTKLLQNMKTGINEIRHAKISEELEGDNIKDPQKRKQLYDKMMHSGATQMTYIRKLKDNIRK